MTTPPSAKYLPSLRPFCPAICRNRTTDLFETARGRKKGDGV